MGLSECDIQKYAVVLQDPVDLPKVFPRVLFDVGRGTPGATMYHGVHRPLIKGNIDEPVGNFTHVSHVHLLPDYAGPAFMSLGHYLDNLRGEVDAYLTLISTGVQFGRNHLRGEQVSHWFGLKQMLN